MKNRDAADFLRYNSTEMWKEIFVTNEVTKKAEIYVFMCI